MHVLRVTLLLAGIAASDCAYKSRPPSPPPGYYRGSPASSRVHHPHYPHYPQPPTPYHPQRHPHHHPYAPKRSPSYRPHHYPAKHSPYPPKPSPYLYNSFVDPAPVAAPVAAPVYQQPTYHHPQIPTFTAPFADDDKGPIHTIPAPNLGPADRPASFQSSIYSPKASFSHQYHANSFKDYQVNEDPSLHKPNSGSPSYFAPDPDPSVPTLRVPPTHDPHSIPTNGQVPLDLYIQEQETAAAAAAEQETSDNTLTAQDLFNLLNYQPNVMSQHLLQPNQVQFVNPIYLPQAYQGVQFQTFNYDEQSGQGSYPINLNSVDSAVAGSSMDEVTSPKNKTETAHEDDAEEIMKQDEDMQRTIMMYENSFPKSSQEHKARKLDLSKVENQAELDLHNENYVPYGTRIRPKRF